MKKVFFGLVILVIIAFTGWYLYRVANTPLPGEAVEDMGRDHVASIEGITYNSNPPTSGPHFTEWTRQGVYAEPISDGNLIHSLEHGYVIVSYDCEQIRPIALRGLVAKVQAHEGEEEAPLAQSPEATESGQNESRFSQGEWQSSECLSLKNNLQAFYDANSDKRLIILPRPGMESPIALTAWTRILKLEQWDSGQAQEFLNRWNNRGPERTTE